MLIFSEICQLQIHNPFTYDNRKVCEFWVHFASRETCIPKRVHNIPLEKGTRNTSRKNLCAKDSTVNQRSTCMFVENTTKKYMKKIVGQKFIKKNRRGEAEPAKNRVFKGKITKKIPNFFLSTVGGVFRDFLSTVGGE